MEFQTKSKCLSMLQTKKVKLSDCHFAKKEDIFFSQKVDNQSTDKITNNDNNKNFSFHHKGTN